MSVKKVKFNLAIANYRPGQIVDYDDMPPGHKFWIDNKDILGSDRICEFVKEETVATDGNATKEKTKTLAEINQAKMNELQESEQEKKSKLIKPKNQKKSPGRPKGSKSSGKAIKPRKKIIQHDATTTIL